MKKPTPHLKRVLDAIEVCEEAGRKVVGFTIMKGGDYHIDFAQPKTPDATDADLVTMGK